MRHCITDKCYHFLAKRMCALLPKMLIPARIIQENSKPFKACPILGGHGAQVVFDYRNLQKYDPCQAWREILQEIEFERRKNV